MILKKNTFQIELTDWQLNKLEKIKPGNIDTKKYIENIIISITGKKPRNKQKKIDKSKSSHLDLFQEV